MAAKKSKQTPYKWSNGTWHAKPEKKVKVTLKNAPPGTYDPIYDQQERAAKRGLGDLITDTATEGTYAASDYQLGVGDIGRQRTELGEDIGTSRQRALDDYLTQRQGVQRNYQRLGNAQAQNFQAAGLAAGGAGAQAAAKRAANMGLETTAIDTAQTRSLDDLLKAQTRGDQSLDRSLGQLSTNYQRGADQRSLVTVPRAQRELSNFQTDTAESKMRQYTQMGGNPSRKVTRKTAKKWRKLGVI